MIDSPIVTERSNGIDALRAFMALWVLFSHLSSWTYYVQGEHAVNVVFYLIIKGLARIFQTYGETHPAVLGFIVLSGYCIHRNGLRRHAGNITSYFIRRAFRIYPIYILAILVGILFFNISMSVSRDITHVLAGTTDLHLKYIAAKFVGISAFLPWLHSETFQGNAPLHTVMVEIWLYVLYPITIILVLKRYSERTLWVILLLVWVSGVAFISSYSKYSSWWHNGSIFGYVVYWWIGAKFIDAVFAEKVSRYYQPLILGWLSLTAVLMFGLINTAFIIELRKVFLALLIGILVTKCDRSNLGDKISNLGKAGYSIYALHAPLVYTLVILGESWPLVCISVVLLGIIIFKIYENPLLKMGKKVAESWNVRSQFI